MMRVGDGWTEPETLLDWLPFCTHGTVDVACARFGYPLYRYLRDGFGGEEGGVRVWRASHFGGHVFAPTLIDLPSGLYWAYVTPAQARPLIERSGTAGAGFARRGRGRFSRSARGSGPAHVTTIDEGPEFISATDFLPGRGRGAHF